MVRKQKQLDLWGERDEQRETPGQTFRRAVASQLLYGASVVYISRYRLLSRNIGFR